MDYQTKKYDDKKIHFLNELNKESKRRIDDLLPVIESFIGKKIKCVDNTFTKAFQNALPKTNYNPKPLENGFAETCDYLNVSYRSIWLYVTICFNGGSYDDHTNYCTYEKNSMFIGEIDDQGVLISIDKQNRDYLNKAIDGNEQKRLIDEYNQCLEKIESLRSKIVI